MICGAEGKILGSKACILMGKSKKFEYGNLVSFYFKNHLNITHFIGIGEVTFIQDEPGDNQKSKLN